MEDADKSEFDIWREENDIPEGEVEQGAVISVSQIVTVCRWLVGDYAALHNYTTDDIREKLSIEQLVEHTIQNNLLFSEELEQACIDNDIDGLVLDALAVSFAKAYSACALLLPLWSLISAPSAPLKLKPVFATVNVVIGFEDDTCLHVSRPHLYNPKDPSMSTGYLVTMFDHGFHDIQNEILANGLDKLREERAQPTPNVAELHRIMQARFVDNQPEGIDE